MIASAKRLGVAAASLGGSAVALGAFGAHALRNLVPADSLVTWRTAVDYQFWHALALLATAALAERCSVNGAGAAGQRNLGVAGFAIVVGTVAFSGSLYGLVLGAPRWTGVITPIGGVILIIGWIALLAAFLRRH